MNKNPTPEEVRASIVPKSDQLNADDLLIGPITVTITGVSRGDKEQPIFIEVEGHQPYKPCKTMRRLLVAVFSDDPKQWIGQRMTLYCDPDVKWGGVKIGGIRISHLSGLENPRTFLQTTSRGKRAEVTIQPLPSTPADDPIASLTAEDEEFVATATYDLATSASIEELKGYGETLKTKSKPVQDLLRPIYAKRQEELQEE